MEAEVSFRQLPVGANWKARVYHQSKPATELRKSTLTPARSTFDVKIAPLDLLFIEVAPPQR